MADPAWWLKAVALETEGRLDEAIETLRTEMTGEAAGHWESQTSYLFEKRAARLAVGGDHAGAREAAKLAVDYAWRYASGATSGGEGVALSEAAKDVEHKMARYLR